LQEQAKHVVDLVEELKADPSLEQHMKLLVEQIEAIGVDPTNQEAAARVNDYLKEIMNDPSLQAKAKAVADELEEIHAEAVGSLEIRDTKMFQQPFAEATQSNGQGHVAEKMTASSKSLVSLFSMLSSPEHGFRLPVSWRHSMVQPLRGQNSLSTKPSRTNMDTSMSMPSHADGVVLPKRMLTPVDVESSEAESSSLASTGGIKRFMTEFMKTANRRTPDAFMGFPERKREAFALFLCFAFTWLAGFSESINNKIALAAAGGAEGFPMTFATLQVGVSMVYYLALWLVPDGRKKPEISFKDYLSTWPLALTNAGQNTAQVFALSAGALSFSQIIKASGPAYAAVIGTALYGVQLSAAKWITLIPVIGGVIMASAGELNFSMGALITAILSSVLSAFRANENKRLLSTPGLKERIGCVSNQFALTSINSFIIMFPLWLLLEGKKWGQFLTLVQTNPTFTSRLALSGMWFILGAELSTQTTKKTSAVTMSVAQTASKAASIVVGALVLKESLGFLKLSGSAVTLGGVFLYSLIDVIIAKIKKKTEEQKSGK
jgi:solute carrier family 35 protein E1